MYFIDDIVFNAEFQILKNTFGGIAFITTNMAPIFEIDFFLSFVALIFTEAILLVARRGVSRFNNTWKFNLDLVVKIASFVLCRMHML